MNKKVSVTIVVATFLVLAGALVLSTSYYIGDTGTALAPFDIDINLKGNTIFNGTVSEVDINLEGNTLHNGTVDNLTIRRASILESNINVTGGKTFVTTDPYIDARAYGVRCDGVTDDTNALQTAIDSCNKTFGTQCKVSATNLDNCVVVDIDLKSNIVYDFSNTKFTLRNQRNSSILECVNQQNITIIGGIFDGNRDNQLYSGLAVINFTGCSKITVKDVTIINGRARGILFDNWCNEVTLDNIRSTSGLQAFSFASARRVNGNNLYGYNSSEYCFVAATQDSNFNNIYTKGCDIGFEFAYNARNTNLNNLASNEDQSGLMIRKGVGLNINNLAIYSPRDAGIIAPSWANQEAKRDININNVYIYNTSSSGIVWYAENSSGIKITNIEVDTARNGGISFATVGNISQGRDIMISYATFKNLNTAAGSSTRAVYSKIPSTKVDNIRVESSANALKQYVLFDTTAYNSVASNIDALNDTAATTASFQDSSGKKNGKKFASGLILGLGTSQINMTLTAPNGNEACCGINNTYHLACTIGAC